MIEIPIWVFVMLIILAAPMVLIIAFFIVVLLMAFPCALKAAAQADRRLGIAEGMPLAVENQKKLKKEKENNDGNKNS